MNRRGFLGALTGLAAGAFTGVGTWFTQRRLVGWHVVTSAVVLNETWICVVPSSTARELQEMPGFTPVAGYGSVAPHKFNGELGTFGGFRIISKGSV